MSDDRNQPRAGNGWPRQPPLNTAVPPAGPAPRRRRSRKPLGFLIALLVLAVVLVAADFAARAYAENMIASKIDSSGLGVKPSVSIEGWPFLTQVAAHDVRAIDISARDVKAGKSKIVITSITAKATGVHLNSSFNGATVSQINGTALITFRSLENDLGQAIGIPGLNFASIKPDPAAGPDAATASVGIGGATIASVTARVRKIGPRKIMITFSKVGGLAQLVGGAASIPDQVINIPKLPAGLAIKSVTVTSQGIVATAAATDTTFSQLSPG